MYYVYPMLDARGNLVSMLRILRLSIFCMITSCIAEKLTISQNPPVIMERVGQEAQMDCLQETTDHNMMYWYQQVRGQGLMLIAYMIRGQSASYEGTNDITFEMGRTKGDKHSFLKVKSLTSERQGVYFCASSDRVNSASAQYFGAGTILYVLGEGEEEKDPKVKVFPPNKNEFQVHKLISLVCIATGFFPEHVRLTWYVNGVQKKDLYQNVPTKELDGTYSTSKRLSLTESEYFNPDSTFKCEAAFIGKEDKAVFDEIKGEQNCGVSKESFAMMINQGKISYIMVLFKSAVYALIVLVIIWRKKVLSGSC